MKNLVQFLALLSLFLLVLPTSQAQNIGIGTTSPTAKLHVVGTGKFESQLDMSGQNIVNVREIQVTTAGGKINMDGKDIENINNLFVQANGGISVGAGATVNLTQGTVTLPTLGSLTANNFVTPSDGTFVMGGGNSSVDFSMVAGSNISLPSGLDLSGVGNFSLGGGATANLAAGTVTLPGMAELRVKANGALVVEGGTSSVDFSLVPPGNISIPSGISLNGVGFLSLQGGGTANLAAGTVTLPGMAELRVKENGILVVEGGTSGVDFSLVPPGNISFPSGLDLSGVGNLSLGGGATANLAAATVTLPGMAELRVKENGVLVVEGGTSSVDFSQVPGANISFPNGVDIGDLNGLTVSSGAVNMTNSSVTANLMVVNTLLRAGANGFQVDGTGNVITKNLDADGNITATGTCCSSDERYKKNIRPVIGGLDKVLALQGVEYDWRCDEFADKGFTDAPQIGFIAQDMEEIVPEMVNTADDGYKAVFYDKVTVILVEAVKEQQTIIENQATRMADMEAQIAELQAVNAAYAELAARLDRLEAKADDQNTDTASE